MAKLALTWRESVPPPEEKRETKVVRLLRDGGDTDWGATEVRSSYVYPVSLRPLRKIAGVGARDRGGDGVAPAAELKEPAGLDVSQLLDQVFPTQSKVGPGDKCNSNDSNNINDNNNRGNATAPGNNTNKSKRGEDKSGKGNENKKKAGKPVFYPYGNANTAPSSGGVVYGGYMLSHSIIPQVFPNKPHTRQVHSGTQRLGVRAAARAKAATAHATRTSSRTATTTRTAASGNGRPKATKRAGFVRTGDSSLHPGIVGRDGGHVRQFYRRAGAREKVKAAPAVGGKQDRQDGGKGDEADASEGASRSTVVAFDPVTLFSALPEDIEPWGLTKPRSASTAKPKQCRPRTSPGEAGGSLGRGDNCGVSPVGKAAVSPETPKVDGRPVDAGSEEAESDAVYFSPRLGERPVQQQQHPPHEWTLDSHLANDPRNYKFLPRGWAGELITPAGVTGPRPSSTEASIPGWTAGWTRKGRGASATSTCNRGGGGDECGVGDCLRWNPGS